MNKTVEIICNICEYENKNDTLYEVFKKVFESIDEVEILKKRALIIQECENVLKEINADENSLNDIFKVLSYPNLNIKFKDINPKLVSKDASHVKIVFSFYDSIQRPNDVDDIVKFSDELRSEVENDTNITKEQKDIIYEICEVVDEAKNEHSIIGNKAIKKLYEILIGKMFLYKNELSSIKSEKIKDKIIKVYKKVNEVNRVMGFLLSIKNNVSELIDIIS